jgi:hypothetical protein
MRRAVNDCKIAKIPRYGRRDVPEAIPVMAVNPLF